MKHQHKDPYKNTPPHKSNRSGQVVGAIILLFGIMLLVKNLTWWHWFPYWLFSWKTAMLIIGLALGVNSKFRNKTSLILIGISLAFIWKDLTGYSIFNVAVPIIIIVLGVHLSKRYNKLPKEVDDYPDNDEYDWDKRVYTEQEPEEPRNVNFKDPYTADGEKQYKGSTGSSFQYDNQLKLDVFFSDVKKIVLSKRFEGGVITNIFGSTQVNLLQADFEDHAVIDIFQLFGSIKIIVPPDWAVSAEVTSVMGDIDDRRKVWKLENQPHKVIILKGSSFFGSIAIRNN